MSVRKNGPLQPMCLHWGCRTRQSVKVLSFTLTHLHYSHIALLAAPTQLDSSRPDKRPFEGELASTTLWPEVEKVFGHGYEVTMDASPEKVVLNSPFRPVDNHRIIQQS